MFFAQKKVVSLLVFGSVILVAFAFLAVVPLLNGIFERGQEYITNQKFLAQLIRKESLFKDLEYGYQEKEEVLSAIRRAFLSKEEIVGFISTLEKLAEQTDNVFEIKTVASSVPNAQQNKGEYPYLVLRVSLWGNFKSLLLFLANLEDSPYPPYRLLAIEGINIKRIKISKSVESIGASLETILTIKVYTQ